MKRETVKKIALVLFAFTLYYTILVEKHAKVDTSTEKIKERIGMIEETTEQIVADVSATMYNAVESQCDSDPLITAGMYKINPHKASDHKWVALSRDLLKRWGGQFTYGQKIQITGCGDKDGIYTIVDTMNPRFKNKIDILETKGTPIYKYENVRITLL